MFLEGDDYWGSLRVSSECYSRSTLWCKVSKWLRAPLCVVANDKVIHDDFITKNCGVKCYSYVNVQVRLRPMNYCAEFQRLCQQFLEKI